MFQGISKKMIFFRESCWIIEIFLRFLTETSPWFQEAEKTQAGLQANWPQKITWKKNSSLINENEYAQYFSPLASVDKEIKTILSHIFLVWLESFIKYWTDCPLIYQNIKMLNQELSWILKQLKGNCVKIKYLKANS